MPGHTPKEKKKKSNCSKCNDTGTEPVSYGLRYCDCSVGEVHKYERARLQHWANFDYKHYLISRSIFITEEMRESG